MQSMCYDLLTARALFVRFAVVCLVFASQTDTAALLLNRPLPVSP
jgi:hypothetical protein